MIELKKVVQKLEKYKYLSTWQKKIKSYRKLLIFVLLASVLGTLLLTKKDTRRPISYSNQIIKTPVPNSVYKFNELVDIDDAYFTAPNPPRNHRSVISLLHDGIPLTKYLATSEGVPTAWKTFENGIIKFRYPDDLYIADIAFQRLAFYKTIEEANSARSCFEKYSSIFNDNCAQPVFVTYYAGYLDSEYQNIGNYGWAALYGLDGREWRAEISGKPGLSDNLSFETATSSKIINMSFKSDIAQNEQRNLRDQAYSLISSLEFINDLNLINYKADNPELETVVVQIEPSNVEQDLDQFYSLLPIYLDQALGIDYIPMTFEKSKDYTMAFVRNGELSPDKTKVYYANRYVDTVKLGEYTYKGADINVFSKSKELVPYISDPKYCSVSSDCVERSNFCEHGAYNKYHPSYSVFGCGGIQYEGLTEEENALSRTFCSEDKTKIYDEYKYDGIECVNNSCQIVNPRLECTPI